MPVDRHAHGGKGIVAVTVEEARDHQVEAPDEAGEEPSDDPHEGRDDDVGRKIEKGLADRGRHPRKALVEGHARLQHPLGHQRQEDVE